MAERYLIVDHLKLGYDGLLNVTELYALISSWFYEKGWDWYEKLSQEQTTSTGKQVRLILEPWKSITDYYKLVIAININLIDLQEVEVKQEGKLLRLSQGAVRITFDGYVISDRQNKWRDKPWLWFLSAIFDKYFFREHFQKAEIWIKSDLDDIYNKIKNYLNVFKYTYQH